LRETAYFTTANVHIALVVGVYIVIFVFHKKTENDLPLRKFRNSILEPRRKVWLTPLLECSAVTLTTAYKTRRPASADRTVRRQFQATGQPVSRMQASDAMTPRYEAKCVQRRCSQWGSVPLRSDIKGTELPPANILIPLERQLIALQLCR